MNRERRYVKLVIDRKSALVALAVVLLVGGAGLLASQQLTMTATYPIPAGVYNQIVTTGNSGTTPANTTLNSKAGNTILVPPTNAGGGVGIGVTAPAAYARLDVNTSGNKAIRVMDSANGGLLIGFQGPTIQARTTSDGNTANLTLQGWGGKVGIGMAPNSALSVAGGVQLGDDTSACTAAKEGTQRWHSSAVQVCSVGTWRPVASLWPTGATGGFCTVVGTPIYPATSCMNIINHYSLGGCTPNSGNRFEWCPSGCAVGFAYCGTQCCKN